VFNTFTYRSLKSGYSEIERVVYPCTTLHFHEADDAIVCMVKCTSCFVLCCVVNNVFNFVPGEEFFGQEYCIPVFLKLCVQQVIIKLFIITAFD